MASWNHEPADKSDMAASCEAIRLVMALSRSSSPLATTLTIEETNVDRFVQWFIAIVIVSMTITVAVLIAIADCADADADDWTCPWLPLGNTLGYAHQAVVAAATGHLMLFLPRAPFVVCEALHYAGLLQVSTALLLSNIAVVLLFNQLPCVMIAWLCFLAAFVAAAIAFWICLVRTYGGNASLETIAQEPREKSLLNTVIEDLAYLYSRLLYECATNTRFGVPAWFDAPDRKQDASNLDYDLTFPWLLLGNTLMLAYQAVVAAEIGHLMLFLPRAPLVACEALHYVGLVLVGAVLAFSNIAMALLFYHLP